MRHMVVILEALGRTVFSGSLWAKRKVWSLD